MVEQDTHRKLKQRYTQMGVKQNMGLEQDL